MGVFLKATRGSVCRPNPAEPGVITLRPGSIFEVDDLSEEEIDRLCASDGTCELIEESEAKAELARLAEAEKEAAERRAVEKERKLQAKVAEAAAKKQKALAEEQMAQQQLERYKQASAQKAKVTGRK